MVIKIPESSRANVLKLQQTQQQLQMLMMQKQNVQSKYLELENAIKEVDKITKEDVYEIVGNVMIKRDRDYLKINLIEKKETISLRQNSIDKQIERLNKMANELQSKIMEGMK